MLLGSWQHLLNFLAVMWIFYESNFLYYRNIIEVVDERMLVFDPKEDNEDFFYHGQKQQRRDLNKKANRDQKFAFDVVFGPNATNEDVYAGTTKGVILWDKEFTLKQG